MVYDWVLFAASAAHILFGAFYFGMVMFASVVFLPALRRAKTKGELLSFQVMIKRMGPLFPLIGIGTLVTGVVFFLVKFWNGLGGVLTDPEPRTVLMALAIYAAVIVEGVVVVGPKMIWMTKQDFASDPTGAVPADVGERIEKVTRELRYQTPFVLLIIVLMVVGANGGI